MERKYRVVESERRGAKAARLTIDAKDIAAAALPGQFAHIVCGGGVRSILRRPLSISDVDGDYVSFLFQVKGEGTAWLAGRAPGDMLDVIAPLGKGCFSLPSNGRMLLAAGGMGIAPMLFLAKRAAVAKLDVTLLFGASSAADLDCVNKQELLRYNAVTVTEDGSGGLKGLVTELLEREIASPGPVSIICACGPKPMLKAVAAIGSMANIPVQVSLEELMACGVGACRGCVVEVKRGNQVSYQNVCSAGPVFDAREVF